MNAVGVKIRGSLKKGTNYTYPCRLNLYLECTTPEIGIDDFEKFALNRLLGIFHFSFFIFHFLFFIFYFLFF